MRTFFQSRSAFWLETVASATQDRFRSAVRSDLLLNCAMRGNSLGGLFTLLATVQKKFFLASKTEELRCAVVDAFVLYQLGTFAN